MNEKVIAKEDKLLRQESYIRRERHVCFGLTVLCVFVAIISHIAEREVAAEVFWGSTSSLIVCLLGYAYYCTLRLRHIDSIKYYRGVEPNDVA